jgi:group I intron endonuclease
MVVYLITNKINGKKYVGQTVKPLHNRWIQHGKSSNRRNTYFTNAIQKYGRESFKIETLRICHSKPEMDRIEKFYIAKLGTLRPGGYNLTTGGEGTPGHTVSKAGRLRMRKAQLGKKHSEETKAKRSASLKLAYKEGRHKSVFKGKKSWNFGKRNKHCKHGHINFIRLASGGGCTECHRIREQLRRNQKRTQDGRR